MGVKKPPSARMAGLETGRVLLGQLFGQLVSEPPVCANANIRSTCVSTPLPPSEGGGWDVVCTQGHVGLHGVGFVFESGMILYQELASVKGERKSECSQTVADCPRLPLVIGFLMCDLQFLSGAPATMGDESAAFLGVFGTGAIARLG